MDSDAILALQLSTWKVNKIYKYYQEDIKNGLRKASFTNEHRQCNSKKPHRYDHNFVLSSGEAARLTSPESGISMTVTTDLPGMQLYTANSLSARKGKGGSDMGLHSALCLETQMFPNAINCPEFASPVLKAGEKLISETVFKFEIV